MHKPKQLQTSSTVPTCRRHRRQHTTQCYAHGSDHELCTYFTDDKKLLIAFELCGADASGSNKRLKSRCRTGAPLHPVVLHSQLSRIQKGHHPQYGH
eukprot:1357298-Amphidinium_carterae.1